MEPAYGSYQRQNLSAFFTNKADIRGKGTGLGLSLAYDIVKAHGGELRVLTNKDEGSTFIIQLPIKSIE